MKKTVLISLAAVAIIATAGWNVKQSMDLQSKNEMSALTIADIEALSQNEGDSAIDCKTNESMTTIYTTCSNGVYMLSYFAITYSCEGSRGFCSSGTHSTTIDCNGRSSDSNGMSSSRCS
jgi:hypothetical protein